MALRCAVGAATASQCHTIGVTVTQGPPIQSYLLLPGLNPVIPVIYGIIGIVVAVVIHEGMHGVIARRLKLPVRSTGLLFFLIVPIGAFVEIDDKEIQKSKFRDSGRIMAGGPGSNIIVALVALAILLVIVGGLVPAQFNGAYVQTIVQGSPADTLHSQGHLVSGDIIVAVNGTAVNSVTSLSNYLNNTHANESLILSISHAGQIHSYTVILATYPSPNVTRGFIGIAQSFSRATSRAYSTPMPQTFSKTRYCISSLPGIFAQANSVVPFSNELANLYSSPSLGGAWYPLR